MINRRHHQKIHCFFSQNTLFTLFPLFKKSAIDIKGISLKPGRFMPLIYLLPHADRITRVCVARQKDRERPFIKIQYTNPDREWFEIELSHHEASHLHKLLEMACKEPRFDSLKSPPGEGQ